MEQNGAGFTIHFPDWYDERAAWEVRAKGWLQDVVVELVDGRRFSVFFYDPIRLAQDLKADSGSGRRYVAEPGLVIIPEVACDAIMLAVNQLVVSGFFEKLMPLPDAGAINGPVGSRPAIVGGP